MILGNTLRDDYKFRHTFTNEIAKFLKASPGQVVMLKPEKFRSKHEPSSHTLNIKVSPCVPFISKMRGVVVLQKKIKKDKRRSRDIQ